LHSNEVREGLQADIPQSALQLEICFLGEVANLQVSGACHGSGGWFFLSGEVAQESGLANAVGADQREPRTFCDRKGYVGKNVFRAERFRKGSYSNESHRVKDECRWIG